MRVIDRFGYYLGGFSVGLIFLGFVFSGKKTSCNYGPSARVKNNLLQKKIDFSPNYNNKIFLTDSLVKSLINVGVITFLRVIQKKIRVEHIL